MRKILLILFVSIFLVNLVSAATTLQAYPSEVTLNPGDSSQIVVSYSISTTGIGGQKGVTLTGDPKFISYSGGSITYNTNTTTTGVIVIDVVIPNNAQGDVINNVVIDGVSTSILFHIQSQPASGCRLIELPHTTNFRVEKGQTMASSQIRIKVSTECPTLSMSVIEESQMSKPMFLQGSSGDIGPGEEFSFTVGIDAVDVATGPYSNTYIVSANSQNEVYQKAIQLSVDVTSGTNPVGENSFESLPVCTIESDMALNNTYSLFCNNDNPLIYIDIPYNDYFKGINVPKSGDEFEYVIQPMKTGVTTFRASFKFLGLVPIGTPFEKQVRIMQGSVPVQGTELKILFYQNDKKLELAQLNVGTVKVLIKDSNADSIVSSFVVYLNGNKVNDTFSLEADKSYEMIVDSEGYLSKTLNFTINQTKITFNLNPNKEFYITGDSINITTDISNFSIMLNGIVVSNLFTLSSSGNSTIKVVKEGYVSSNKTIEVRPRITYTTMTPLLEDWKKGKKILIELSKNTTWNVYRGSELVSSGNGNLVEFKIKEEGTYQVKSGDYIILSKNIEGSSWFGWIKNLAWYWWVAIVVVIGGIFLYVTGGKSESTKSDAQFVMEG